MPIKKVMMIGFPSAGKSTVSAALLHSVGSDLDTPYSLVINPSESNKAGKELIYQWMGDLRKGRFPNKTLAGEIFEIDLGVKYPDDKDSFSFTIVDASGEVIKLLDVLESKNEEKKKEQLARFKSKLLDTSIFLLVTSFEDIANQNELFFQTINAATQESSYGKKSANKKPLYVSIIITGLDTHRHEFPRDTRSYRGLSEEDLQKIGDKQVAEHLGFVLKNLRIFAEDYRVFPVTVGEVESKTEGEIQQKVISKLDLSTYKPLTKWLINILQTEF